MDEHLGIPSHSDGGPISVDEALSQIIQIQESSTALFLERRAKRLPGEPTRMQSFVLRTISRLPSLTVTELAEILNVSAPTASQLIATLVDRGWLNMDLSPQDRRKHDIKITEAGIALLGDQTKKRLSRVRQVLEQLTDEERTQLIQLLKRTVEIWQSTEGRSTDGH